MTYPALKLSRSILAAVVAAVAMLAIAPAARAGMVPVLPNVGTRGLNVTYKVASTGIGVLNITGMDYTWQTDPNAFAGTVFAHCAAGTFSLNAYFDLTTGKLLNNYSGTSLTVLGERTLGNVETLYKATRLVSFDCVIGPSPGQSTFDFMWQKDADAGTFANGSTLPFIGTIAQTSAPLMNADKSAGATATSQSYVNSIGIWTAGANSTFFQSNSASGTANTFMTPTPEAFSGGIALLAIGGVLYRRRETMGEAN